MTRPAIVLPSALAALGEQRRWLIWRYKPTRTGKPTKVPYQGHRPHKHADTTDPLTWCVLDIAMWVYRKERCHGIGYVITDGTVAAIDLDDCRNKDTGELHPWAADVVTRSATYCEITPSGEGIRVIGLTSTGEPLHCAFPVPDTDGVRCELYRRAERYITVTGQQHGTVTELVNLDALLDDLHAALTRSDQAARSAAGQSVTRGSLSRCTSPYGNLNQYALDHPELWVPKLFPAAYRTRKGGYRVSSRALGRNLQEDLSITPIGIVDWGVHDMGDPKQGRRSPITLVMEWQRCGFREAVTWLLEALS
jgi:hypothetical protein